MKKRLAGIMSSIVLLVIGATIGPVAIAAFSAWMSAEERLGLRDPSEASRLVEAYRQRLPIGRLFLSVIPPEDGAECGYDPGEIFPEPIDQLSESMQSQTFTEYAGYYYLERWTYDNRDKEWISAITASIDEQLSEFEAGFLRRCIEATLFSDICMNRVAEFGDSDAIPRFDHDRPIVPLLGIGIEDQIVCTYVDGVAARRNVPLSSWKSDIGQN